MNNHGKPHRVVIIGAGFGGLSAAQHLKGAGVAITIIDRRNHHLFQPLLYQVATTALTTSDIAWPIRNLLQASQGRDDAARQRRRASTSAARTCCSTTAPPFPTTA